MPFRFVHTADVHLDSPLRSLALRNDRDGPDLAELIGDATRGALAGIVDLCLDERVDALMIAGDLYDGDQTSMKTALFLARQLQQLDKAGIRTFIVRGNHDAQSRITRELALPDGVKVFGGRGEAVELDRPPGGIPVAVHGISFAKPRAPESLVPKFKPPVPGAFNIGLLHTSLRGSAAHDDYAPCSVSELAGAGLDYWCLGHVHKREVHCEAPYIVMPGMPQGRDVGEAGPKSATMVRVGDDGSVDCRAHPTCIAQFERIAVDLTGVEEWRDMAGRIGAVLKRERERVDADHLVVRLELRGATGLAWRLRRYPGQVKDEAYGWADTIGNTWIEEVDVAATADGEAANPAGPVGELVAEMRRISKSENFQQRDFGMVDNLVKSLPPEAARRAFGDSEAERRNILKKLIAQGCEATIAHLLDSAAKEPED